MRSILFIHRSVGQNLIDDGNLRKLLSGSSVSFNDYNQNLDILTSHSGEKHQLRFSFPSNDTKPSSYAQIFTSEASEEKARIRDHALDYDVIVIKSCYPNNNIDNVEQLENLKASYLSTARFFNKLPAKELIILTSPPLTRFMTTKKRAHYARHLANWLSSADLGKNVSVFNLYDLLADPERNHLKWQYRRLLPFDSHPNKRASLEIAPKLSKFLITKSS